MELENEMTNITINYPNHVMRKTECLSTETYTLELVNRIDYVVKSRISHLYKYALYADCFLAFVFYVVFYE